MAAVMKVFGMTAVVECQMPSGDDFELVCSYYSTVFSQYVTVTVQKSNYDR